MTGTPSVIDTVEVLSSMSAILGECLDEVIQRFCHLREVSSKSWPVVLFQVDIHRVVTTPR